MSRRNLFLVGAVVLAVILLAITIWLGPHTPTSKPRSSMGTLPGKIGGGAPEGIIGASLANQTAINWYFDALNKRGQLTQIWGRTLSPLPQGQSLVNGPVLRLHLSNEQVLEIRAESAVVDAPNNTLRRGEFQRHVVLTLFEAQAGRTLDLRIASPDAHLRLFLDNARFDMEIGQIDATGPVQATSPTLDFTGEGLNLSYSEGRDPIHPQVRVNRLVVPKGREIRVARQTAGAAASAGTTRPAGAAPARAGTAATRAAPATQAKPVDYYKATLADNVTVHTGDNDLAGDGLVILFSGQQGTLADELTGGQASTRPAGTGGNTSATTAPATQSANPLNDPSIPQPLFHASDSDLIAKWSGPLTVEPVEQKPAELAGPADRLLVLTGKPARITSQREATADRPGRHEVITAVSARYLLSSELIDLQGDAQIPVDVDSERSGYLHGQRVVLNQREGTGDVLGPGTLLARRQTLGDFYLMTPTGVDSVNAAIPGTTSKPAPPAPPERADVNIAWTEHAHMTFAPKPEHGPGTAAAQAALLAAPDSGESLGLGQLKTATFQGNVTLKNPQLDLAGQTVALAFEEPEAAATAPAPAPGGALAAARPPGLKSLHVVGQAAMHSRNADPRRNMDLTAPEYKIEFVRNSLNRTEPRHFLAQGPVQITQPGQKITASRALDVGFYDPHLTGPAATQPANSGRPLPDLDVRTMLAAGAVHIDQDIRQRHVAADIVSFDARTGVAELTGTATQAASITEPAGTLVGRRILVQQAGQKAEVIGSGALHLVRLVEANEAAATQPFKPGWLDVLWQEKMAFDNALGQAQFFGDVKSSALDGLATYAVTGKKELTLHFLPPPDMEKGAAAGPGAATATDLVNTGSILRGPRRLTSAIADGDATFQAETWTEPHQLETRLHLDGPAINFDNLAAAPGKDARQMVWIDGPGKALFEDYRPEPPHPAGPAIIPTGAAGGGGGRDVTPISSSGRGKTLFTWARAMELNLLTNHMLMTEMVRMIYEPAGSKDTLQLDTQQLSAQLTSASAPGAAPGLEGWIAGRAVPAAPRARTSQPSVQSIQADGTVRASWTQVIIDADHMVYDGPSQLMIFSPDPGKRVEVTELDKGTAQPMQRLLWSLGGHHVEFEGPGPTHAPPIAPKAK